MTWDIFVELARWFRTQQRRDPNFASRHLLPAELAAKPRTQLVLISRRSVGRAFLAQKEKEFRQLLDSTFSSEEHAQVAAQLGSVLHLEGKLHEALSLLEEAVSHDERKGRSPSKHLCKLARVTRQIAASVLPVTPRGVPREPTPIARVDASSLTVEQFLDEYACPGVPVVLLGLVHGGMFTQGFCPSSRLERKRGVEKEGERGKEGERRMSTRECTHTHAHDSTHNHARKHTNAHARATQCPAGSTH